MKMHKLAISLFVVVSWCICQNSATLLVFDGDQLVGNYSAGLIVFQGLRNNPPAPITAPICTEASYNSGCIVLLNEPPPPEKWARIYQAKNAAGIIIGTNGLAIGYGNIQTDNKDTSDVYLPTFDMPGPTMEGLLASVGQMLNEGKNVTGILSYERDQWVVALTSPWIYVGQIINGALLITNLVLSIYCWYWFIVIVRKKGIRLVIPHVVLALIVAGTLLQIIAMVDISGFRRIYPITFNIVFFTLPAPFILSATILMTFYWHECISRSSIRVNPFLTKAKVPFFISCAVLFAFMIISTCLRVLTVVTAFNYVELAYYVIIVLGLAIFFIVTAVKVMKQIRLSQSLSSERKSSGERVTRVLFFIASTLIQYFLALAFAPALVFTAQNVTALYFWQFFSLHLVSLAIVVAFYVSQNSWQLSTTSSGTSGKSHSHLSVNMTKKTTSSNADASVDNEL
jgi:hypothetical protein